VEHPPSGTVTFLFTDIAGSTRRWQDEPESMAALLAEHDAILRDEIERHEGHLFKHTGDGVAAAFPAASGMCTLVIDPSGTLDSAATTDSRISELYSLAPGTLR